jgi:photosystem II stability/assembly factor-like uncharacterized protein
MKTTDVRKIKAAINEQANTGRKSVTANGYRIISVKKVNGVLHTRRLGGTWEQADSVEIN